MYRCKFYKQTHTHTHVHVRARACVYIYKTKRWLVKTHSDHKKYICFVSKIIINSLLVIWR